MLEPTQVLAALAPQTGVEAVIRSYGWDDETALAVFKCENGYNTYGYWRPDAVSVTGDYGIVQLNAATWNPVFEGFWENWMDPEWNIARGWDVYVRAGYNFWPWNCY